MTFLTDIVTFLEQPEMQFVAMGLSVVVASGGGLWSTLSFWRRARSVEGAVTDLRSKVKRSGDDRRTLYYPILQFTTSDGREVQTEGPGANPSPVKQGARVTVYYDPDDPTTVALTRVNSRLTAAVSGLPIGLLLIAAGIIQSMGGDGGGMSGMTAPGFGGGTFGGGVFGIIFDLFPFLFVYIGLIFTLLSLPQLRLARRAGGTTSSIAYAVFTAAGLFFVGIGLSITSII